MRKETIYEYFKREGLRTETLFNEELIGMINLMFKPVKYGTLNEIEFENRYCLNVLDDILARLIVPRKETGTLLDNAYIFVDENDERYCLLSLWCPQDKTQVANNVRYQLNNIFTDAYEKARAEHTPHFLSQITVLESGLYDSDCTIGVGIPSILLYYYMMDLLDKLSDNIENKLFESVNLSELGGNVIAKYSKILSELKLIKEYLEE